MAGSASRTGGSASPNEGAAGGPTDSLGDTDESPALVGVPADTAPPAIAATLQDAEHYQDVVEESVWDVLETLMTTSENELSAALRNLNLTTSEVIGSASASLDRAWAPVVKVVDAVMTAQEKGWIGYAAPVAQAGIDIPDDALTMSGHMATDAVEWLPYIVPEIGRAMGLDPAAPPRQTTTTAGGGEQTDGDGLVHCDRFGCSTVGGGQGSDTLTGGPGGDTTDPADPAFCPPAGDCTAYLLKDGETFCRPGFHYSPQLEFGTGNVLRWCQPNCPCPPDSPPTAPPPPSPPVGGGGTGGGGDGTCCAPTNITNINNITGGTVTITEGGPSGSPPTSPPPPSPPTVPFYCPDVDVNVTVPPILPPPSQSSVEVDLGVSGHLSGRGNIDWSSQFPCRNNFAWDGTTDPVDLPPPPPADTGTKVVSMALRLFTGALFGGPGDVLSIASDTPAAASSSAAAVFVYNSAAKVVGDLLKLGQLNIGPDPARVTKLMAFVGASEWAERQTGLPINYFTTGERYAMQWMSPQFIPSVPELNVLFNTGRIDMDLYECMVRGNGVIPKWAAMGRDAQQGRPGPHELVTMYKRGQLTEKAFRERMMDVGWRNPTYQDDAVRAFDQYPGLPDQVRFMVRDATDEDIAAKFQYDKDFDEKFGPEARRLAAATGVPEFAMRLAWRSHWEIPSNTALTEMFHRLRWDRPERVEWEKGNPRLPTETTYQYRRRGPLVVTRDDVQEAIEVNDMAPGWVPAFIDIMFRPITNSDAARAYQLGTMSRENLVQSFRTNGYSPDNAEQLAVFWQAQKDKSLSNLTGVLTLRQIASFYRDSAIQRFEADRLASSIIPDVATRNQFLDNLELSMVAENKQRVVKLVKRRFMYGQYNDVDVMARLGKVGVFGNQAIQMVSLWNDERDNRSREATAKQLCQWFAHKLIDQRTYLLRLQNLGYDSIDAGRIAGVCQQDAEAAAATSADRKARQARSDARQARSDAEKAMKDTLKALTDKKNGLLAQIKKLQDELNGLSGGSGSNSPPPPPPRSP